MSPIQLPVCVNNTHTRPRVVRSCSETLYYLLVDEEDSTTSRRVESIAKYKLPTYQAAAVVVGPYFPFFIRPQTPTGFRFFLLLVHCPCRSGIAASRLLQIFSGLYSGIISSHAAVSLHSYLHLPDLQRELHHQFTCPHQEFRECPHARCALPGEGKATAHHTQIRPCHLSVKIQS